MMNATTDNEFAVRQPDRELEAALEATRAQLERWIVASWEQITVLSLFIGSCWVSEAFDLVPHVALRSAEPESGKSRTIQALQRLLGPRARVMSNVSLALLARRASEPGVTILLDETDRWLNGRVGSEASEGLIGLIDACFERGTEYSRMARGKGDKWVEEIYYPFAPVVLAGLRDLPATIASRSIPIWLRRKRPDQVVHSMRQRDSRAAAAPIVAMWETWSAGATDVVRELPPPPMPARLSDRQQDVSEPLVMLADLAGGTWPGQARAALSAIFGEANLTGRLTIGTSLLIALQEVWAEAGDPAEMPTVNVLEALVRRDDGPWARRYGDPTHLADRQKGASRLAADLRPFEVRPVGVRTDDGSTPKGYRRRDLEGPWLTYADAAAAAAAAAAASSDDTPTTADEAQTLWDSLTVEETR